MSLISLQQLQDMQSRTSHYRRLGHAEVIDSNTIIFRHKSYNVDVSVHYTVALIKYKYDRKTQAASE